MEVPRFNGRTTDGLTDKMLTAYHRAGVLVLENLISEDECNQLKDRMGHILETFDHSAHNVAFSTRDQRHARDAYFYESARDIRFFFEEGARDATNQPRGDFRASLNKVGHALHDLDPVFHDFCRQMKFKRLAESFGLANPLLVQSMYIFKPARIGGEVALHQDATYLWTEPQSCVGFWLALDDADRDNGCLWGLPGAHRESRPRKRFRKPPDGTGILEALSSEPWPSDCEKPLEAPKGTLVILHSQFPHRSGPNLSERTREAFALHLIDGHCRYSDENWLQWRKESAINGF